MSAPVIVAIESDPDAANAIDAARRDRYGGRVAAPGRG